MADKAKESQQDIIEKVKKEAAEKAAATKKEAEVAEKPTNEDLPDEDPDAALAKMEAEAAKGDPNFNAAQRKIVDGAKNKIFGSNDGANSDDREVAKTGVSVGAAKEEMSEERVQRSQAAYDKLKRIARDFHPNDPDEHVIFGRAGIRYTIGDLRDLLNLR